MNKVAIINYNAGNTLSVMSSLKRLGAEALITSNPLEISQSSHIIFPGVGHAAPAAKFLRDNKLDIVLKSARQPVLGICLGMQLMCDFTEEGNTKGLGIFNTSCRIFPPDTPKIPHMGWNSISVVRGRLFTGLGSHGWLYFVHSYRAETCSSTSALCNYGTTFSAALERDNFFGVQFHPEKSSADGESILKNFLELN